jgi:hypothetical protein
MVVAKGQKYVGKYYFAVSIFYGLHMLVKYNVNISYCTDMEHKIFMRDIHSSKGQIMQCILMYDNRRHS